MSQETVRVVPANLASAEDLRLIFGTSGDPSHCHCQYFMMAAADWKDADEAELAKRLPEQAHCGDELATTTTGLVAYRGGAPAGWCAVEPRAHYERLRRMRLPWLGRDENPDDPAVWAITCFVTRTGHRRQGVMRALAAAAIDFARERGATSLEAYPEVLSPGSKRPASDLYVGVASVLGSVGFTEVTRPSETRAVMSVDFAA